MKPEAIIVNTSRGPVIDEVALTKALADNKLFGAGLDVFDQEPPPPDNPIFKLRNVVLTSHFAGPTWDNHVARFRNAFDNVQRVARGEKPRVGRAGIGGTGEVGNASWQIQCRRKPSGEPHERRRRSLPKSSSARARNSSPAIRAIRSSSPARRSTSGRSCAGRSASASASPTATSRIKRGKKNGVFAAQAGPGIENAFPGIAQAYAENVPLLIVSGGAAAVAAISCGRCSAPPTSIGRSPNGRRWRTTCRNCPT